MYVLILVGMHVCVCTICTNSRGHVCEGVSMCIRRLEVNIEILLNNLLPYPCCFGDRVSHETYSSTIQLAWLGCEFQSSASLCHSGGGIDYHQRDLPLSEITGGIWSFN